VSSPLLLSVLFIFQELKFPFFFSFPPNAKEHFPLFIYLFILYFCIFFSSSELGVSKFDPLYITITSESLPSLCLQTRVDIILDESQVQSLYQLLCPPGVPLPYPDPVAGLGIVGTELGPGYDYSIIILKFRPSVFQLHCRCSLHRNSLFLFAICLVVSTNTIADTAMGLPVSIFLSFFLICTGGGAQFWQGCLLVCWNSISSPL
jgi:hypothetical protein